MTHDYSPWSDGWGGHQPPDLLFLCGWCRKALAGWHRLASGLVRRRKDGYFGDTVAASELPVPEFGGITSPSR
jgi:hypothetical protein